MKPDPCHQRAAHDAPLAFLHYERNELEAARSVLEQHRPSMRAAFLPAVVVLWHQILARLCLAQGATARHESALEELSMFASQRNSQWMRRLAAWERVAQCLRDDDVDTARAVVRTLCPDTAELERTSTSLMFSDDVFDPAVGAIRYCIHDGYLRQALALLATHAEPARHQGSALRLTKLQVLQSLACAAGGRRDEAATTMALALRLGEKHGAMRTFLDEGWRCATLLEAMEPALIRALPAAVQRYRRQLLQAFVVPPDRIDTEPTSGSRIPLMSRREVEILRLVSEGHTNQATARTLSLSTNTVKWHLAQIYSKLQVSSRTQAVHALKQQRSL